MAVTITAQEVKDFSSAASAMSDTDIDMMIAVAGEADACLDANGVGDDLQRLLKLNAIMHLITKSLGGQAKSQRDFDGASVSYSDSNSSGQGLSSSSFGQSVRSLDVYGCFNFLDNRKGRFVVAVGRNHE